MPRLSSRYCGMVRYFSNSACQSLRERRQHAGHRLPFHDRKAGFGEPRRAADHHVTNISAATASSHEPTARRRCSGGGDVVMRESFACCRRRGPYSHAATASQSRRPAPCPSACASSSALSRCIVLVTVWALVAMALAQMPVITANGVVEAIYYVVAGLGWVLPAMPLIRWMSKTATADPITGRIVMRLRRVDAAEAVPHRGRGARHQHPQVAQLLVLAVERNARQRHQMLAMLREQHARPRRHRGLEAELGGDAELARPRGRRVADRIGRDAPAACRAQPRSPNGSSPFPSAPTSSGTFLSMT